MCAEVGFGDGAEDFVGISADGSGDCGVAFGEFGGVAVYLDDFANRDELLPVEAALLKAEAGAESEEEIGLLEDDIGVTLAPCVGAAEVERVVGGDAVHGVPGGREGNADVGESAAGEEGVGGGAVDAGSEEDDGALGGSEARGDAGDGFGRDGREGWGKGWDGGTESDGVYLGALDVERNLHKDGGAAAIETGTRYMRKDRAVDDGFQQYGTFCYWARDSNSIDLLNPSLADFSSREVRQLYLATDHKQLATLKKGTG